MIPEHDEAIVGRPAPAFEAPLFDGGRFALEAEHGDGKALVLAFWASWCAPCRDELPALAALQRRRDDVRIVAVNVDRERERAEAFLRKVSVDLPIVVDDQAHVIGRYDVIRMPSLVLLDDAGTVTLRTTGYDPARGHAELEEALDALRAP